VRSSLAGSVSKMAEKYAVRQTDEEISLTKPSFKSSEFAVTVR
jgi:hypothetical protein